MTQLPISTARDLQLRAGTRRQLHAEVSVRKGPLTPPFSLTLNLATVPVGEVWAVERLTLWAGYEKSPDILVYPGDVRSVDVYRDGSGADYAPPSVLGRDRLYHSSSGAPLAVFTDTQPIYLEENERLVVNMNVRPVDPDLIVTSAEGYVSAQVFTFLRS